MFPNRRSISTFARPSWALAEPDLGGPPSGTVTAHYGRRGNLLHPGLCPAALTGAGTVAWPSSVQSSEGNFVGSVIKKRRKRMAKKKHRKLLKKTRIQRRNKK